MSWVIDEDKSWASSIDGEAGVREGSGSYRAKGSRPKLAQKGSCTDGILLPSSFMHPSLIVTYHMSYVGECGV